MATNKIQSIGRTLHDSAVQNITGRISDIKSIQSLICLPDIHIKEGAEAPCSFVVATYNSIVSDLTAPSVGCGMGMIVTSLTRDDITPEKLELFYRHMRNHLGPRYGSLKNILLWIGIIRRPVHRYDFSKKELSDAVMYGGKMAVKKYHLPTDTLTHVEYGGDASEGDALAPFSLQDILPRAAWVTGRHNIGYGFKGNHFLEVQYVDEIIDESVATKWNLKKGGIVIMYHGGGGAVSHYLARYFANRKKDRGTWKSRTFQFTAKLFFHFLSINGIRHAYERWHYYFTPEEFEEIPANSYEGRRVLTSLRASLNYSYAFRLAIVKRIYDALDAVFGADVQHTLLWDNIHNSIRKEQVGTRELFVHRHTATRIFKDKPVIIPGFNNTNSYIGIGLETGPEKLFSVDHGAGETIKRTHQEHFSKEISGTTDIYTAKEAYKKTIPHITREGLDAVIKPLEEIGLMKPVVYTKPIAVFKG
jgi:tRNA-splicing ligase RtcB (3'-phosphate/5'-hydroxy nucleic acid ligase)